MRTFLVLSLLSLACSFSGVAQSIKPPKASKQDSIQLASGTSYWLYVGLAASKGAYRLPNSYSLTNMAPMLTVGVQLKRRLALQLGAAFYQQQDSYSAGLPVTTPPNSYVFIAENSSYRGLAVPATLRYTLTRQTRRRLQADLSAGAILVHMTAHQVRTVDDTRTSTSVSSDEATTGVYLALGPSLSYRLTPDLELTSDLIFNKLLNKRKASDGYLSANLAVGVRYRFKK